MLRQNRYLINKNFIKFKQISEMKQKILQKQC